MRLVLASASPARLATLRAAGIEPRVVVSELDEEALLAALLPGASPADAVAGPAPAVAGPTTPPALVLALARAKAEEVAGRLAALGELPDLVLGCDSMLEFDGQVVGKPGTPAVAIERWRRMSGRTGLLHTGHWLLGNGSPGEPPREVGRTATTAVHFADLTDEEIEAYVGTGEPLVVAGGFTVDGLGGPYVRAIAGDYHNVVGLSLPVLRELLAELGIAFHRLWSAR